ncbi:hypothetical protein C7444_1034 [Sphaerotilus hippei]|uniref:DUF2917 family protein n=1 Tax=Sphaerotilus hippei TaxID=744406 RepID=A0A318HDZ5_9BURK|nr:hypothetical protein C7444_1034 [Sphaerotilus hippei]
MEMHLTSARGWRVEHDGELRILGACAWVTRAGDAEDHVMAPGAVLPVRRGQWLTLEPWRPGQVVRARLLPRGTRPQWLRRAGRAVLAAVAGGLATGLLVLARRAASIARRAQGPICTGESMASSGALK